MTVRRAFVWAMLTLAASAGLWLALCPKPELYGDIGFSTAVNDRNGVLLRLALADDDRYRLPISLSEIAPAAIDATLLYEDQYFRSHPGFNGGALVRAAWSTYVTRERTVGGSTITMQLARLRFDLETRSVSGKLRQIARAIQLERHYSKDEILQAYLNLAPYGSNIEGIGTASLIYFGKPAARLSVAEALALAVIPQNPVARNPITASGYDAMMRARGRLAAIWQDKRGLPPAVAEQLALPLVARAASDLRYQAPHFSGAAVRLHGGDGGGVLTTTLDWATQALLEQRIESFVERRRVSGIENASAMLLDYRTMEIIASVGSAGFFNDDIEGQVDGTQAKRSPGSTLKPFVYALAMDRGLIHPMTMLKDAPTRFAAYTPENFDRGFMGPVFAEEALIYSRNVPAIKLLARVGHKTFNDFLNQGHVAGLREPEHYGLAMVLGGNELTMRELVRLYAMLANGGISRPLVSLAAATDSTADASAGDRLLSPEASFLTLDMLRNNPRPDEIRVGGADRSPPIAWKTGTSYAYRDAWTVGVFGPYVLAVWVGNFDGSGNPALVGREAAAPLFFEIADAIPMPPFERTLNTVPSPDLNLLRVDVCSSTGDLPGRYCPQTKKSWFIPGRSPITVSNVHRAVRIDNQTGKRSCSLDARSSHEAIYEFWPSDIERLFRKAGIARRQPPPFAAECSLDLQATTGQPPTITSPSARLTYPIRADQPTVDQLPLTAATDADVQWLYWFANDTFIARVPRDEPLFWSPDAGEHELLVVDDLGRSHARSLRVSPLH